VICVVVNAAPAVVVRRGLCVCTGEGGGVILCLAVIFLDLGDRSYLHWMWRKGSSSSSLTELLIFFLALCYASSVLQSLDSFWCFVWCFVFGFFVCSKLLYRRAEQTSRLVA
jgi:hypothetical protein